MDDVKNAKRALQKKLIELEDEMNRIRAALTALDPGRPFTPDSLNMTRELMKRGQLTESGELVIHEREPGGRLKHAQVRQLRAKLGKIIYEHLKENKGKEFKRGDLEHLLPPGREDMFYRIIQDWNSLNPKQPITDNGEVKSGRRYWIK